MQKQRTINEQIAQEIKRFDIRYGLAVADFNNWLIEQLNNPQGRTIRQIVNEGWELFEVDDAIKVAVLDVCVASATIQVLAKDPDAIINEKKLRSEILNKPWTKDNVTLSSRLRLANTETKQYITSNIKQNFSWVKDYEKNFKSLQADVLSSGKIDESILRKKVRQMTSSIRSSGFSKSYDKDIKELEKEIAKLAEMNYPTSDTKKAYQGFIRGVKGKSKEAFEKSVEEAIKKKSRYIARRIARTEQARASIDAYILMTIDDEDLQFYKWNLDASHKITDICDINAKADFGLGSGVFPKDRLPSMPAHPHCICFLTEYYPRDEVNESDFNYSKGGNAFLKIQDARTQNLILTSHQRGQDFRKGADWNDVIRTIDGKARVKPIASRFTESINSKYLK